MNDSKDLYDIASDIMDKVSRAADGGSYEGLSRTIDDDMDRLQRNRPGSRRTSAFLTRRPGKAAPIIKQLFGWPCFIFLVLCAISILPNDTPGGVLFFLALSAPFGWLAYTGLRQKRLTEDFYAYARVIGNAEYMSVAELAGRTGQTAQSVQKSLAAMMKAGLLPTARFDDERLTLILTDQAWNQYSQARAAYLDRQKSEAAASAPAQEKTQTVADECAAFSRQIRAANDRIPDPVMSAKLDKLEAITARIADRAGRDPASAASLRKFLNYYVPTTRKLLDAYVLLDRQVAAGDNIAGTKRQIEEAMDAIIRAYETILDSLFEDVAWDISSDISVMKTMMAQDGLAGDALKDAQPKASEEK
jgi:DNA-binding MarR family transcriptional regulator